MVSLGFEISNYLLNDLKRRLVNGYRKRSILKEIILDDLISIGEKSEAGYEKSLVLSIS